MDKQVVQFQLFGNPKIKMNGKAITFSFTKVNALLYYLIVNKSISRDEIAGLLWPDKTEKSAKKNLRNTIYQANKVLGEDFILAPNNKTLEINPNIAVESDIDTFNHEVSKQSLDVYKDVFLKGFYIKDSEEFDFWIGKMRTYFEQTFIQRCYANIQVDIENNQFDHVEERIKTLIAIDEFDERNYQLLMQFYQNTNRNSKVIEVYYSLVDLLERELDIAPSKETRLIYERTLQIQNKTTRSVRSLKKHVFFGRYVELNQLEEQIAKLFNGTKQHVIVKGSAGVGKSTLVNAVLQRIVHSYFKVSVICHRAEQAYRLRPIKRLMDVLEQLAIECNLVTKTQWNKIIQPIFSTTSSQSVTFKSIEQLELLILEVIQLLQVQKPLIIFIEDIHWIDEESARLINRLMLNMEYMQVLFILTVQKHHESRLLNNLSVNNLSTTIIIPPFSQKEVQQYVEKRLGNAQATAKLIERIFKESEGLPFYVDEYINLAQKDVPINRLTLKMQEFLKEQFGQFDDIQLEILTLLSYFEHFATVDIIQQIVDYDIELIEETIQEAIHQGLIYETIQNNIAYLAFLHHKYKEYLYFKQTYTKKRMVHKKIAFMLEKIKSTNASWVLFDDISYHFSKAHLKLRALAYQLEKVELTLTMQHEIFPLYHAMSVSKAFEQTNVETDLASIQLGMSQLDEEKRLSEEFKLLDMKYLLLKGKFFIRCGKYDEGITFIQNVITRSELNQDTTYLFEAYKQMIYYAIQIEHAIQLKEYVQKAMQLAIQSNNYEQMGMLLRIEGVYYLMIGQCEQAEKQLHESIHIYSITKTLFEKYQSNIAASYDYLAEIARYKENFEDALMWHNKAIKLCQDGAMDSSGVIFYLNRGITYYVLKEHTKALQDFDKAKDLISSVSPIWKKIQLDAYYALCQVACQNDEFIIQFINENQDNNTFSNPRDEGIVCFVKAKWLTLKQEEQLKSKCHLEHSQMYYIEQAKKMLNCYRDANIFKETLELEDNIRKK
ncbi:MULTISPECIES: AAA family ATPase [unclassified Granulicatella]|uniref:AAA family ATPase n=1 Tax=unclassified Granulicatella TaxID=2630493 RepID=UPI001073DAD6|nr:MULTISPECIES: AAA family ATPase [unclassified Granulicatella]MBF0780096.1 AAA family ATPase [Granulicatella sp. 19428wC4_WM01]TFU95822.1 hypothetical protein E4T68_03215 [Granulicatella sp. WM01]